VRPLGEQTVLVTGATDGLGRGTARALASRGARVLVHGRDEAKARRVVEDLRADTGNPRVEPVLADLASMAQARALADRVRSATDRLDALVNNAGVGGVPRQVTSDGYELHLAVNHLAHFALTLRLLDLLRASAPARVVNVSSGAQAPIDFDDPMLERGYEPYRAYAQSKLAQVLFTVELARRVAADEVTVNALHPASLMDTRMVRESFGPPIAPVSEGVEAVVRLVVDPALDGVTGRYFDGTRESTPHAQARDARARARLWELSERLAPAT
jgi:NAD(P)-dependent dehydrogenase (short-subunit alcohol dehydrogenase family)